MNHRIVKRVVVVILLAFIAMALLFALAIRARVPEGAVRHEPARIPHGIDGEAAECHDCHNVEDATLPLTHRYYPITQCRSCHSWRAVTMIPHSTALDDTRCLLCHGDPGQDLGMPEDHINSGYEDCSFCHAGNPDRAAVLPRPAGVSAKVKPNIPHGDEGAFATCTYCHRVDSEPSMPMNHRAFTEQTCDWCHAVAPDTE